MTDNDSIHSEMDATRNSRIGRVVRGALQIASGAVPMVGGVLSAIAGAWSEREQAKANRFFEQWVRMHEEEIREKEATFIEIIARLNLQDEKIIARVESKEFQSLVKKAFRDWAGVESEQKRILIRNILSNAAASVSSSDDVVRIFINWIAQYSELHFQVIGAIYNSNGITRGAVWRKIGRGQVREDSADADLYKLLFRDLSTGGVIRQYRKTNYHGNFIAKPTDKRTNDTRGVTGTLTSAFDDIDRYVLTELGLQFVHYAMTDLPPRIEYQYDPNVEGKSII